MSTSFQSCPGCESFILADTYECPECGHVFDEERSQAAAALTRDLQNQNMYDTCRKCGESVRSGLVRCWNCNTFMRKDVEARYEEMQASPQPIIFSDVPKDQRTELIEPRADAGNRSSVYDAQDDDDFEFTLRSGDELPDEFELATSIPQRPVTQSAPAPAAPTPAPAAAPPVQQPAPESPAAEAPAAETPAPADSSEDKKTESAVEDGAAAKKPETDGTKSVDDFDADDLVGIALQDQKESRQRKKKKVEEARSKRILLPCSRCGAWIRVHQEQGGRTLRCRQCKFPFVVPQMKKKSKGKKARKGKAGPTIDVTWLDDVSFHVVAPTDIVLKPGSLEKGVEAVDLGFHESGLQVLKYSPPAKKSLFGKADGPPAVEEQRKLVREHIAKTGTIAELPFGDLLCIDRDNLSKVRLVQPVAEAHESMFAGVPVFGAGRIALYLPITLEENKQSFVSLPISSYRKLADQLKRRFGTELNAQQNGVPVKDEMDTLTCKLSEMPVTSIKHLEYYENDPGYELELSGYLCGTCGIAVGEPARAQQKLGGAAGKGIAKAKCPGCSNKMGDQKVYKISKSPSDSEEADEDNDDDDPSSVMKEQLKTAPSKPTPPGAVTIETLQGKWKMISLGRDGNFDNPEDVRGAGIEFAVEGNKYMVSADGNVQEQGVLTVNSGEDPVQLDQEVSEGADAGKSHLGVVRIVDGKLQNCQAAFGEPRPEGFESEVGSTDSLAVFERV